eukprot:m.49843 g.49843  ORF g.49843 m.49843 type:complete len:565 (+) comp7172_c0_seq2:499-2193(+)
MMMSSIPMHPTQRPTHGLSTTSLSCPLAFFFVFGGFYPAQSFASSLLNFTCVPLGDISIGVVYLVGALGALIAPALVGRWGTRACMVLSSLVFIMYTASVTYIALPAVVVTSLGLGMAGVTLNVAQGVALGDCVTDKTRGLYSGIFQAAAQGAALPGNLIASFVIPVSATDGGPRPCGNTTLTLLVPGYDPVVGPLFAGCALCCVLGTVATRLYVTPPPTPLDDGHPHAQASELTLCASLKRVWRACTRRRGVALLIPLLVYTGMSIVFWSGMYTRQMDSGWVGPAICILAGGEILGGMLMGRVLDKLGIPVTFIILTAMQGGALTLAHFANLWMDRTTFWIAAGLLGFVDCGTQTTAYATLSNRFVDTHSDHAHSTPSDPTTVQGRSTSVVETLSKSTRSGKSVHDNVRPYCGTEPVHGIGAVSESVPLLAKKTHDGGLLAVHATRPHHHHPRSLTPYAPSVKSINDAPDDDDVHSHDDVVHHADNNDGGLTLDAAVGFATLNLVQGLTVAVLFFGLPLAAGTSGRSSDWQFFMEEVVTLGLMVIAAICLVMDGAGHVSSRVV